MEKKNNNLKGYGLIIFIFVVALATMLIFGNNISFMSNIFSKNSDKEANNVTVYFENKEYSCEEGESFETLLKSNNPSLHNSLKSYRTTDEEIATIDTDTTYVVDCSDCIAVRVVCKKEGNVKLVAESVTGSISTSSLSVASKKGTISFDKNNYSCEENTTFETIIRANSNTTSANVKSFSTSDSSIATIDTKTQHTVYCTNCKMVRVVCKKTGNVKLYAESTTGATTSADLEVTNNKGTISYGNSSYSCTAGSSFETTIRTEGSTIPSTIKSYSTSDSSLATIDTNTTFVVYCTNCLAVRVNCLKTGNVKLYAESSTGATTSVPLEIKDDKGTISYSEKSYTCEAGKTFDTLIKASGGTKPATIKSYSTSDPNVATIDDKAEYQTDCTNCRAVRVYCKNAGDIKLYAESSTGATTTSTLKVTKDIGSISFSQSSFTCEVGQTFETVISAKGGTPPYRVQSFNTSDSSIATVDTNTRYVVNCINCINVRVVCKKAGTTKINATSTSGAKASVSLKVTPTTETISYSESNYTCEAGQTFQTLITVRGSGEIPGRVKSYSTSNSNIATVDNQTEYVTDCYNCTLVRVVCKKKGNVTLYAESTNGATTSSNLSVTESIGTIYFEKDNFTCKVGQNIETLVKTAGGPPTTSVASYYSANDSIASIDSNSVLQVSCVNCRMLRIVCKAPGSTKLTAVSSTGAKATVNVKVTN